MIKSTNCQSWQICLSKVGCAAVKVGIEANCLEIRNLECMKLKGKKKKKPVPAFIKKKPSPSFHTCRSSKHWTWLVTHFICSKYVTWHAGFLPMPWGLKVKGLDAKMCNFRHSDFCSRHNWQNDLYYETHATQSWQCRIIKGDYLFQRGKTIV